WITGRCLAIERSGDLAIAGVCRLSRAGGKPDGGRGGSCDSQRTCPTHWMPAFAGMTDCCFLLSRCASCTADSLGLAGRGTGYGPEDGGLLRITAHLPDSLDARVRGHDENSPFPRRRWLISSSR